MKAELGFDDSTLPERLLIEQVLLCWLRLSLLEREQAQALTSRLPYAYLNHLQAATTQAQRRYTNAISSLARVRRLLTFHVITSANSHYGEHSRTFEGASANLMVEPPVPSALE